jgi:hypothetical protein
MKKAETKYKDIGVENVQLYHNLGATTLLAPGNVTSISEFFNPWSTITAGTGRNQRVGDRITPRGMSLKLYLANKVDRPNTMVRLIVAVLPKMYNNTVTTNVFFPFQVYSGLGNNMIIPADTDKGVKFLYDRVHTLGTSHPGAYTNVSGWERKERTKIVKLWIKRKSSRDIIFDNNLQEIVNKPLAVFAIPYEQYSTIATDNIMSLAGAMRMYYKDV